MIKNDRGVTLIALTIAVIVILTITGMLVYSAKDSVYVKNLTNMQNDISNLRDKVSLYYSEYGKIPAQTEYPDVSNLRAAGVIGANDTGKFLIIELEILDGLTLNYGKDYETYKAAKSDLSSINLVDLTDIYIINENSNNIFYVQGVGVQENNTTKMYYTDYTEGDKEAVILVDVNEYSKIIPDGFYYVGGTKESGIVISDSEKDENKYEGEETVGTDLEGNQYVWIPVDGILGEDGTIDDVVGNEKKILLGRYEFDESGIPSVYSGTFKEETRQEHVESGYKNTVAKNIENFIKSVKENSGYYIARYEASYEDDYKVSSKYNGKVYNKINQTDAAVACKDLNLKINKDLMNSYAWDTALLFIQKYAQHNYSRQASLNSSLENTGISGDVQLNIYDMASNCSEWTTESSTSNDTPCINRGGYYYDNRTYSSIRITHQIEDAFSNYSFRPIIYL